MLTYPIYSFVFSFAYENGEAASYHRRHPASSAVHPGQYLQLLLRVLLHWGTSPPSAHTVATWTRCLFFFLKGVLLPSVVSIAVWFRGEAMTVYAIYLRELHQRNLQGHHLFYCFRVGASVFRNLSVFGYYDERMSFFPNTASYHKVVSGCMGPC